MTATLSQIDALRDALDLLVRRIPAGQDPDVDAALHRLATQVPDLLDEMERAIPADVEFIERPAFREDELDPAAEIIDTSTWLG